MMPWLGMTEERLNYIGETFYNLKKKGTGFELIVCNKIVHEHRGTINIKTFIIKGSYFIH
jgi:two-component system, sporulation sensor kinase A